MTPTTWVQSLLIDIKSVPVLYKVWMHVQYQDQAPADRSSSRLNKEIFE